MRIPSADEIFGNRAPGAYDPGSLSVNRPADQSGIAVGNELRNIGKEIMNIGLEEHRHNKAMDLIKEKQFQEEQQKKENELLRAKEKRDATKREKELVTYQGGLTEAAATIFNDKEIPFDKKWSEFEKVAEERKTTAMESFIEENKDALNLHHEGVMWDVKGKFTNAYANYLNDKANADVQETVESLERRAAISPKDREDAIKIIDALDMPGYSEVGKQKIKADFKARTAENEADLLITGVNTDNPGRAINQYKKIRSLLKDKDKKGAYTYLEDMDVNTRLRKINAVESGIKAEEGARNQILNDVLKTYKESKLAGFQINDDEEAQLQAMVKGTDKEKVFKEIKQKGESEAYKNEQLAKDPLTFGAAQLNIRIEPLNLQDSNTLMQQIKERKIVGVKIKAVNNLQYTPILTTDEVKGLVDLLNKQDAGSVKTINNITHIVGDDTMMSISQQISREDKNMGIVLSMVASGQISTAKSIIEGNKYIKDKAVTMPDEDVMREAYSDIMKDGMLGLPSLNSAHYDAFKAHYASLAARAGINKDDVNDGLAEEAFKDVVGEVLKINGKKVVLPHDYNEDRFVDFIKGIDADKVLKMGGVYGVDDPEDAAELIRDDGQWYVTATPGVYRVAVKGKFLERLAGKGYLEFKF